MFRGTQSIVETPALARIDPGPLRFEVRNFARPHPTGEVLQNWSDRPVGDVAYGDAFEARMYRSVSGTRG